MESAIPALTPGGSAGWDIYYVVFLAAVLALGIPLVIGVLSSLLRSDRKASIEIDPRRESMAKALPPHMNHMSPRMNVRFFLAANAALVLLTLTLILIPCVSGLREAPSRGLLAIVTIASLAGLGLLYSSRKGDLSWLKTFKPNEEESD